VSARDRQAGFSLIELLVVVVIFAIIIVAASQSFVPLLSQTKQQSKIAVNNIEGMLGLEVIRRDITHAGYGLYWSVDPKSSPPAPTYAEVTAAADNPGSQLNDAPNGNPRALVFGGGLGLNGSDRIAVKAVNAASNQLSERWAYLYASPTITLGSWTPSSENVGAEEYVVVVRPDQTERYLMFTTGTKVSSVKFKDVTANYDPGTTSIVFSLGITALPKMPFNRADFVVAGVLDGYALPARCAQGTGVLYKKVVNHAGDGFLAALPLLDCVADMQVAYRFDSNADGYADTVADVTANQPTTEAAARQIREVRVYILAQEGQLDRSFTYPNATVRVGEAGLYGRDFNMNTITNWQNYRWKLYTLVIEPICLVDWTVTP
jgi:prepilin-type N-terminal cleavage/methylation domain-containing protein